MKRLGMSVLALGMVFGLCAEAQAEKKIKIEKTELSFYRTESLIEEVEANFFLNLYGTDRLGAGIQGGIVPDTENWYCEPSIFYRCANWLTVAIHYGFSQPDEVRYVGPIFKFSWDQISNISLNTDLGVAWVRAEEGKGSGYLIRPGVEISAAKWFSLVFSYEWTFAFIKSGNIEGNSSGNNFIAGFKVRIGGDE